MQKKWSWPRGCRVCHQLSFIKFGLCDYCADRLANQQHWNVHYRDPLYGFDVFACFAWNAQTEAWLSPLIYSLKGNQAGALWTKFAQRLPHRFSNSCIINHSALVVPCPARSSGRAHALIFAREIAGAFGLELQVGALAPVINSGPQKQKSILERKTVEFTRPLATEDYQEKPVLFVDDVVASGATVRAAYQALGAPRRFGVVCLAHREARQGALS